jgi:hypothetical protein
MAITNGYCELMELREWLGIEDAADDSRLEIAINAASRAIDRYTRRRFFTTTNDETRYYTPLTSAHCHTDDIVSITSVAIDTSGARTYDTTLASTDYDAYPENAALDGIPVTALHVTTNGRYRFSPVFPRSVRVVGKFGASGATAWMPAVKQAALMQATRFVKRKDSPFGIAGNNALGQTLVISDLDPDVREMLSPPIRRLVRL